MKKIFVPLRKRLNRRLIKISNAPLIIYMAVIIGIVVSLFLKRYHEDLSLNLVSEIIGGAFTLFVIDVLLVKSKTRRWKVVQGQLDYLIARTISRLRDGMTGRAFSFQPMMEAIPEGEDAEEHIRRQRDIFLDELATLGTHQLTKRLSSELFTEDNYEYFNEKADELWKVLDMKYSEYLEPELVHLLMELHTDLKDVCANIRLYKKGNRFPNEKDFYHTSGANGAAHSLREVIRIVIRLKHEGYSEPAKHD